ncbi:hypothetical protein CEXT_281511 [Caerostris extrusa]|uniref:Uncharacterized protein n=1 Tax=Caerostris extrusa TaxID=172846 RepID=A0AAV4XYK1_CAEEX|nr:hypothetical protein CEXT_281511 [Caerostris extrusa]
MRCHAHCGILEKKTKSKISKASSSAFVVSFVVTCSPRFTLFQCFCFVAAFTLSLVHIDDFLVAMISDKAVTLTGDELSYQYSS